MNIIHFQRIGNWEGYLHCLDEFLPWCFALNRHNYARDLSYYLMDMRNLEITNPEAYEYLKNGGFSGSLSGEKHTQIPMDQIIESTINRSCKEIGGIIGKTENHGATERWMRVSHILAALKEHQNKKVYKKPKSSGHVELGQKRMAKDEDDVQRVVEGIGTWAPDLWNGSSLVHLSDGIVASGEMISNVLSAKENGKIAMKEFIARFSSSDHKFLFSDPIKKQLVYVFETMTKSKAKENSIPEDECESFGSVLAAFDNMKLDLKYLMNWCVTSKPWMICKESGKSRDPNKSLYRNNVLKLNPTKATNTTPPGISCCIVDGGRLIRIIGISDLKDKTFLAWAETICMYLESLPGNTLHVVFDNYEEPETIVLSKGRKKKGKARKLNHLSQSLPPVGEWVEFLSIDENKQQIISLLCDHILTSSKVQKQKYVTNGKRCFTLSSTLEVIEVAELYSLQREADPRVVLHAAYEDSRHQTSICVVADDTDILVLLLFVAGNFTKQLYFREGFQKSKEGIRYHDVRSLFTLLGSDICSTLPAFHALTGCDYTRPLFGRSKYGIFKKIVKNPKLSKLLSSLSTSSVNSVEVIEFVLRVVYSRKKSEKDPGESRYAMLFTKKKGKKRRFTDTRRLVPDKSSLEMKFKRANCVTLGMTHCLDGNYVYPNPLSHAWKVDENDELVPVWYEGNALPTIEELETHAIEAEREGGVEELIDIAGLDTDKDDDSDEENWSSDSET